LRRLGAALSAVARPFASLWGQRPATRRLLGVLTVLGVAGLGAAGAAFPLLLRRALPGADDWDAAGALLVRDARPGDAVVVSPAWAERLRAVAPPHLLVLAYPRFAGEDLDGIRRLWLVSLPGAPGFSWEAEMDLLERAVRAGVPLALGGLEVARLDVTYPELPLAFFPDRLSDALVTQGGAACLPEVGGGHRCPGPDAEVFRTVAEVGGLPRPCLALRGVGAKPLAVAFSNVPVGRLLRGRAEVEPGPRAQGERAQVRLVLRVDGEEAGVADLAAGGWRAFRFDTGRWAGGAHAVVLEARGTGPAALRLQAVTMP
jgi:hypothetical protein